MRLPCVLLLCLGAATVSAAFVLSPQNVENAHCTTEILIWKKLILTHHWPATFCQMEHCHATFNYWTLHGLWPDNGMKCNSSWAFNSSLIEDIMADMKKSWPDLLHPSSTGFWKYEWLKHGTCAAEAQDLNSQHKYFSKALELYHKLDLSSVLRKFNITPSEEYYKFPAIESAIENFYGVKPKIQCDHNTRKDAQSLGQIEICFDTNFMLLHCEKETVGVGLKVDKVRARVSEFSVCDHDKPVYYPPLQ